MSFSLRVLIKFVVDVVSNIVPIQVIIGITARQKSFVQTQKHKQPVE
jgi:hypothetical protein